MKDIELLEAKFIVEFTWKKFHWTFGSKTQGRIFLKNIKLLKAQLSVELFMENIELLTAKLSIEFSWKIFGRKTSRFLKTNWISNFHENIDFLETQHKLLEVLLSVNEFLYMTSSLWKENSMSNSHANFKHLVVKLSVEFSWKLSNTWKHTFMSNFYGKTSSLCKHNSESNFLEIIDPLEEKHNAIFL